MANIGVQIPENSSVRGLEMTATVSGTVATITVTFKVDGASEVTAEPATPGTAYLKWEAGSSSKVDIPAATHRLTIGEENRAERKVRFNANFIISGKIGGAGHEGNMMAVNEAASNGDTRAASEDTTAGKETVGQNRES